MKRIGRCLVGLNIVTLSIAGIVGCNEENDLIRDAAGVEYALTGTVQKGPFIDGSEVKIQELSPVMDPTGVQYITKTLDDLGRFATTVEVSSEHLEIITSGYYFDEVAGELSGGTLTLGTVSAPVDGEQININLLTHLASSRTRQLLLNGIPFLDAEKQAKDELLALFFLDGLEVGRFDTLDIAGDGEGNAALLAISAVIQQAAWNATTGVNATAVLSEMLAKLSSDIVANGILDDEGLVASLREGAITLDLAAVRANLEARYTENNESVIAAPFEDLVDSDGDQIINGLDDDLPNDGLIVFAPQTVQMETVASSEVITLSGLNAEGHTRVVLEGGTLLHNGAAVTLIEGSNPAESVVEAVNGDTLQIQVVAAGAALSSVSTTLTVGTAEPVEFVVTTETYNYDLTFGTIDFGVAVHDGQHIEMILLDAGSMTEITGSRQSKTVIDGGFSFSFAAILEPAVSYALVFFTEVGGGSFLNGVCDPPTSDHAWKIDIPAVTGHVDIQVSHTPDFFLTACDYFPVL